MIVPLIFPSKIVKYPLLLASSIGALIMPLVNNLPVLIILLALIAPLFKFINP